MRRRHAPRRRLLLGLGLLAVAALASASARAEDEAPPAPPVERPYVERHRLEGHTSIVRCVAFRPGTHVLASGGSDRSIRLWDTDAGTPLASVVLPRGG